MSIMIFFMPALILLLMYVGVLVVLAASMAATARDENHETRPFAPWSAWLLLIPVVNAVIAFWLVRRLNKAVCLLLEARNSPRSFAGENLGMVWALSHAFVSLVVVGPVLVFFGELYASQGTFTIDPDDPRNSILLTVLIMIGVFGGFIGLVLQTIFGLMYALRLGAGRAVLKAPPPRAPTATPPTSPPNTSR